MAFISQIIQLHPDAGYWHQQYPWFSIGHLVNTANKKDTPAFTESAQRAAAFFNDIPRLHWLLHQQETDMKAIQAVIHPKAETNGTDTETETNNDAASTSTANTETANRDESLDRVVETPVQDGPAMVEATVVDTADAPASTELLTISAAVELTTVPVDGMQSFISDNLLKESIAEIATPQPEDDQPKPAVTDHYAPHQKIEHVLPEQAILNEPETDESEPEEMETEEPESIPLPVSMLSESLAQAANSYKNAPLDEDTMVFKTAYQHTIDYFASQGIKLDGEPAKDDRFGQQLKTFTSWLRQMKRLPDAPVPDADPLVESHAAHSLQKGEVVTEPMADVLLKQGKNAQAIAVLEKLRLLHPQKSHYFATRIDQIKHL